MNSLSSLFLRMPSHTAQTTISILSQLESDRNKLKSLVPAISVVNGDALTLASNIIEITFLLHNYHAQLSQLILIMDSLAYSSPVSSTSNDFNDTLQTYLQQRISTQTAMDMYANSLQSIYKVTDIKAVLPIVEATVLMMTLATQIGDSFLTCLCQYMDMMNV